MSDVVKLVAGEQEIDLALDTDDMQLLTPGSEMGLPEHDNLYHDSPYENGERLVRHKLKNRIWPVKLLVGDKDSDWPLSQADNMGNAFTKLGRMIRQARAYAQSPLESGEEKVQLFFQLDGASNPTYYDVVDMEPSGLSLMEKISRIRKDSQASFNLVTKPEGYGDIETIVATTRIENCTDGTRSAFVDISGVKGDLPAPTRITVHNKGPETGTSYGLRWQNIWIAKRSSGQHDSDIVLSDADLDFPSTPDVVQDADYVDGQYTNLNIPGGGAWNRICSWDLSPLEVDEWFGRFAPVLNSVSVSSGVYFKMRSRLLFNVVDEGTPGESSRMTQMGSIKAFPGYPIALGETPREHEVGLWAYKEGGDGTVSMDCIMMLPIDGLRVIGFEGYNLVYDRHIVDDGINNLIYSGPDDPGIGIGWIRQGGRSIKLIPERDERLHFMVARDNSIWAPWIEMDVTVEYQPRTEFLLGVEEAE